MNTIFDDKGKDIYILCFWVATFSKMGEYACICIYIYMYILR